LPLSVCLLAITDKKLSTDFDKIFAEVGRMTSFVSDWILLQIWTTMQI